MKGVLIYIVLSSLFLSTLSQESVPTPRPPPNPQDAAASARYLIAQSLWGVLSTLAYDMGGAPFGNAVSFADGGIGDPYFYLTFIDPTTANYSLKDQRSSFTVSQHPLQTCGVNDTQLPSCARVTLTGKLIMVDENSDEAGIGKRALFGRHPHFAGLPRSLNFNVFKLQVESVFIINIFKPPRFPKVDDYRRAKV
ncbi:Pyridoxamine 5'-phosphate oxidase family protein [Forsythia ovata]|uniref:Pyridoxamine 5'-phosphate oxidase family protein n=1 Tax=Forsythia ovata TaxID=205694 RepID=A0ABD1UFT8_9LAMI